MPILLFFFFIWFRAVTGKCFIVSRNLSSKSWAESSCLTKAVPRVLVGLDDEREGPLLAVVVAVGTAIPVVRARREPQPLRIEYRAILLMI